MSVSANEPNVPDDESQGHPAWMSLLEEVPEDLRPVITPKLEEWERHMQAKLQEYQTQYEPYKAYEPLVEHKVSLDNIQKALWLAQQLETDPEALVKQAIEHYELGYVPAGEVQPVETDPDDEDNEFTEFDITKHPQFQAMSSKIEKWEQAQEAERERQETERAKSALEQTLDNLHEKYDLDGPEGTKIPGFDNLYVAALMAQGVEAEEAIKSYNDTVNARAQMLAGVKPSDPPPPIIMGGDGNTGSGIPNEPVKMSAMKDNDVSDLVQQIIDQAKNA